MEDMGGAGGMPAAGGAGGGADPFGGFDPNMDPELAEAIRLSMQDVQAEPA